MGTGRVAQIVVTVDVFVVQQTSRGLHLLLIQRKKDPYAGLWALPGGKVDETDVTLEDAACREVREETGGILDNLVQVATFGNAGRDPRGRYVSVLYVASIHPATAIHAGDDAANVAWFPLGGSSIAWRPLAFDHDVLIATAMTRL